MAEWMSPEKCDTAMYFRYVPMLCLALGLRNDEVCSMKWSDINFKRQVLTIPADEAKNSQELKLPLTPYVENYFLVCVSTLVTTRI